MRNCKCASIFLKLHLSCQIPCGSVASILLASVNSSINPILYFLAGRNKEDRSRVSMKLVLQRVFKNEEDTKEDGTQPNESQL
ncbi:Mrgprh: Mas-related G-protein coupled receptor member H [Crotalus adamanteus]|uniref:Mrgprh: Mas-related G-protein coupled receptor member H n=1 Tax=Crotalus adamanteus TaxID=8729 RepID=A0AAW1BLN6_CROAD